jgi:hypothetical protein
MKSLLIVSSFLVISIASLFSPSEIIVTFDTPSVITSGESFIMNIEIDKGDISDFAKLQLSLPEGFTAELLEGKEGTFTFYDQKIKLIWISLPSDPKLNVRIKIDCDTSLIGDYNLKGKISYVLDGERKNKELLSPTIKVNPESELKSPNIASNEVMNNTSKNNTVSSNNATELYCQRSFDATSVRPGETFLVTLKVKKSNVSGVGKIIENLPDGLTAKEIENNGAIFSQKENQIKFLWMTLPSDNEFTVSYKIMVDQNLDGSKVIDGKMSYLDGDVTKNALIDGTSINVSKTSQKEFETSGNEQDNKDQTLSYVEDEKSTQESASNIITASNENIKPVKKTDTQENENSQLNEAETKDQRIIDTDKTTASNEKKELPKVLNKNEDNLNGSKLANMSQNEIITSTSSTKETIEKEETNKIEIETDNLTANSESTRNHKVNYRLQICALRKKTETNYFTKNHNVREEIYLNMHEGWHKYTVGNFKEYMSARDHRRTAKSNYKINGSFVTAYNEGSRITVQEALMITKDKWIAP